MAMMFLFIGLMDFILEKTGVFADGSPQVLKLKFVGPILLILASISLKMANQKSDESVEQQDIEN